MNGTGEIINPRKESQRLILGLISEPVPELYPLVCLCLYHFITFIHIFIEPHTCLYSLWFGPLLLGCQVDWYWWVRALYVQLFLGILSCLSCQPLSIDDEWSYWYTMSLMTAHTSHLVSCGVTLSILLALFHWGNMSFDNISVFLLVFHFTMRQMLGLTLTTCVLCPGYH